MNLLKSLFLFLCIISFGDPYASAQYILPANFNSLKSDTLNKSSDNTADGETITIKVIPGVKDAIFAGEGTVNYTLNLKNDYKVSQDGTVGCIVTTELDQPVFQNTVKVNIEKKSSKRLHFDIVCKEYGFYKVSFILNLSSYDDTVKKVFGVAPTKISPVLHKPNDFNAFWKNTRDSLARIAPVYKITEEKGLNVNNKKVYLVEMHSWGNAIVRGWLSVPNRKKGSKIPVKYRLPGYIVALEPSLDDDDFAVFNFNVRGSGNSKDAIDTHGVEYDLYNIENRNTYVYRSVYMDCVRGLDFLYTQGPAMGLDTSQVLVAGASQGGGLAVALAGMDKRVKLITIQVPLFADFRKALQITQLDPQSQTPVGMIANYLKKHPTFTEEKLFETWDYYDPMNFAPDVKVPVLMGIGLLDRFCPPECSYAMYNKLANKRENELWSSPDKTHEVDELYYTYEFSWLQDALRMK